MNVPSVFHFAAMTPSVRASYCAWVAADNEVPSTEREYDALVDLLLEEAERGVFHVDFSRYVLQLPLPEAKAADPDYLDDLLRFVFRVNPRGDGTQSMPADVAQVLREVSNRRGLPKFLSETARRE